MTGGRLKQYGPGKPDGDADKGLIDQYQNDVAPPGPTPHPSRQESVGGEEKFEQVDPRAVRGGPKAGVSLHGGHSNTSGNASPTAQAPMRGHNDASALFTAQAGHAAKRGPGTKTGTDEGTRRKLSTAGS